MGGKRVKTILKKSISCEAQLENNLCCSDRLMDGPGMFTEDQICQPEVPADVRQ